MILSGDSEQTLKTLEDESCHLVFTSPPYFNARDYVEYEDYESYLTKIQRVFAECGRVLSEGRFLVVNSSPVLIKRESRSKQSYRLPIPYDLHHKISELGFTFIDDIVWKKPEGAGWGTSRGRRFAADRNPLQYKTVPVTEMVMVYRKTSDRLIDWNIRSMPDEIRDSSKIGDGYQKTNVWEIPPVSNVLHPATFPLELAENIVRYYSFVGDTVLDPFAGIGTTAQAAKKLGRRFVMCELNQEYVDTMKDLI